VPATTADDGTRLHYETTGDGETAVFVNEAGYGAWQWAWLNDGLAGPYRTVTWDLRGTGRSDTPTGPYSVDRLAADLEAVLRASETDRAHLVGAGLGGAVALAYADRFSRARTLTLLGTPRDGSAVDESALGALYATGEDPEQLRESLSGALSAAFRTAQPDLIETICEWRERDDATPAGFEAQVGALCSFESPPLYEVTLPALVCAGVDDPVVGVEEVQAVADALPRGTFEAVEGRRLCYVESGPAVTDGLFGFFEDHSLS